MIPLAVFLHAVLALLLGPLVRGLGLVAAERPPSLRAALAQAVAPMRALNSGLRAHGAPPMGPIALLALAAVANLLIPFFANDAVLGFLGDGFTALLLLVGLSIRVLPLRATSVMAVAGALWALGTLAGTTDLAEAMATWTSSLASWLIFAALALGVAPLLAPPAQDEAHEGGELSVALMDWATGTLQLGWLALGVMAFPWTIPLTGARSLMAALALFLGKLVLVGGGLAYVSARWPRLPLAEAGLACAGLALMLVTLGF